MDSNIAEDPNQQGIDVLVLEKLTERMPQSCMDTARIRIESKNERAWRPLTAVGDRGSSEGIPGYLQRPAPNYHPRRETLKLVPGPTYTNDERP